jgi:hypothetical protein
LKLQVKTPVLQKKKKKKKKDLDIIESHKPERSGQEFYTLFSKGKAVSKECGFSQTLVASTCNLSFLGG